ncbi:MULTISPECIES: hypothetical protein [unclassified Streptomyces]|uniref:hypothetical protein n=1 Tax=unclassified Streptomyces TaxID=2593676 RepID=UPI0033C4DF2E
MSSIIPDRVADLIASSLPSRVQLAVGNAASAEYAVRLSRGPRYTVAREYALADLARANKILAACDPGLRVIQGGVR